MRQVTVGASVGLLLGLLVGLSVSPVTSIVVSAIAALLGGLLTLSPVFSKEIDINIPRVVGFAVTAAAAVLVGVFVRTHDLLSPSLRHYKEELQEAGVDPAKALPLSLALKYGASPGVAPGAAAAPLIATQGHTVLFSKEDRLSCSHTQGQEFASEALWLEELRRSPGWLPLLNAVEALDPNERRRVLEAAWGLACA